MKENFTTKNGLVLPLLNLRGKEYLQVAHRILWWRDENPNDVITVEFIQMNETMCIAKATVLNEGGSIKAQMHKREDAKHFADYMEKAETGAIGRALAVLGYGTQFTAQEFEEGERLADSPIVVDDIQHLDARNSLGKEARTVGSLEYVFSGGMLRGKTSLWLVAQYETKEEFGEFCKKHSERNNGKSAYVEDIAQLRYLYINFDMIKDSLKEQENNEV